MMRSRYRIPEQRRLSTASWVLVAGGFHRNGGMDRCNGALARYLAERGDRVHLVCHQADPEFISTATIRVHAVPRLVGSVTLGGLLLALEGSRVARQVSLESPGTRVLVNGGNCDWPDINWVHYVHRAWRRNGDPSPAWFKLKNRFSQWFQSGQERAVLRRARVVVANSERTRRDLVDFLKIDTKRIHTVYPGADPGFSPPSPSRRAAARAWLGKEGSKPLVAFVGGLGHDSRKGLDVLFAAWGRLCARPDWNADLIVAGDGRARDFWRRRISESGMEGKITLLGFTDRIPELLAAVDLLVSPVRYESYGLNVAEAICCGVPAMVTQTAGVAECYPVQLRELLICDPEDVDELVAKLLQWRTAATYWKERITPFSKNLRGHTLEVMAQQIASIVESNPSAGLDAPYPGI
jgi:glycosyltransferase involved in cell wall biosynthesis